MAPKFGGHVASYQYIGLADFIVPCYADKIVNKREAINVYGSQKQKDEHYNSDFLHPTFALLDPLWRIMKKIVIGRSAHLSRSQEI